MTIVSHSIYIEEYKKIKGYKLTLCLFDFIYCQIIVPSRKYSIQITVGIILMQCFLML